MFPCSGCGLCCQNISNIEELNHFNLGNGICKYFNIQNNSCTIYNDRPDICKIDKMFDEEYNKYFTKKEFYIKNANACNSLQEQYKIDKIYKINIGD